MMIMPVPSSQKEQSRLTIVNIVSQVDTNCDGTVDWEEYLMFMLLECREKDQMLALALKPFPKDILFVKSEHREAIVRVVIIPYMISSQVPAIANNTKGRYAACSRDGTVTFWSMDMDYKTSEKVKLNIDIVLLLHIDAGPL